MSDNVANATVHPTNDKGIVVDAGGGHEANQASLRMAQELAADAIPASWRSGATAFFNRPWKAEASAALEHTKTAVVHDTNVVAQGGHDLINHGRVLMNQGIDLETRLSNWQRAHRGAVAEGAAVECMVANGMNYYEARGLVCLGKEIAKDCKGNLNENPFHCAKILVKSPKQFVLESIAQHKHGAEVLAK